MICLAGEKVRLRALEPGDVELLYGWENDTRLWEVSGTVAPFSRETLRQFIENQQYDIYHTHQQRFVICALTDDTPLGMIDLFDFDPRKLRAGIGVVICDQEARRRGYAAEALRLLCDYAREAIYLHGLYATVAVDNPASVQLFRSCGFTQSGILRDWSRDGDGWCDEYMFQKLL
jgi:diamine N-acetyltransferase